MAVDKLSAVSLITATGYFAISSKIAFYWNSAFSQSVSQSVGRSVGQSVSQQVGRTVVRSVSQSAGQSVSQSVSLCAQTLGIDVVVSMSLTSF